MSNNYGTRCLNTEDLTTLSRRARNLGLSRSLPQEAIDRLDPEGVHIAYIVVFAHNVDSSRGAIHHRVRVLAKMRDEEHPVELTVDMRDQDFLRLHTVEAVKAALAATAEG